MAKAETSRLRVLKRKIRMFEEGNDDGNAPYLPTLCCIIFDC